MTIGDRVRKARIYAGLKQSELAKKLKTSQGAISDIENNRMKKGSSNLFDIAKITKVSADWLINNEGAMIEEDYALSNVEELNKPKIRKAPVLNSIQAGLFNDIGDDVYDEFEFFIDDGNFSENVFWLRIVGDSMMPKFEQGDLILVDIDKHAKTGDYVVALIDGDNRSTFKMLKLCYDEESKKEYCQLIALNKIYSPVDSRREKIVIRGVAVKHEKPLY